MMSLPDDDSKIDPDEPLPKFAPLLLHLRRCAVTANKQCTFAHLLAHVTTKGKLGLRQGLHALPFSKESDRPPLQVRTRMFRRTCDE